MRVPSDFYRRFWCKTSSLALGTGLVLGYFATIVVPPYLNTLLRFSVVPIGGVVAVLLNQWLIYRYFRGGLRGAFEYVFRESVLADDISLEFYAVRFFGSDAELELQSLNLFKVLMDRAKKNLDGHQFICYMAAAKVANIGGEDRNAIEALKLAVSFKPADAVANFKLARAFERIGSAQEAIEAYESALRDPSIDTEDLKGFIATQALRVRDKGPDQRSPIPGLIYQLM